MFSARNTAERRYAHAGSYCNMQIYTKKARIGTTAPKKWSRLTVFIVLGGIDNYSARDFFDYFPWDMVLSNQI